MAESKNRTQLQKLFKSGAKPSEADFKDLIDGSLNIADDGIAKPAGANTPLKISTHGEQENVLDIYTKDTPTWRLNQKPTKDIQGLNIETGGDSKLFIESSTGNIGLGITKPIAKLHLQQSGGQNALRIDDEANDTTPLIVDAEGKVGIGTDSPRATLEVKGNTKIEGDLTISKTDSDFALKVNGNTKIEGNLSVDKNLSTTGELSITKTSTLTGKVGIGVAPSTEQLKIKGDTAIAGALKISKTASDYADFHFNGSGMGRLQFEGWSSGWNINSLKDGKHLYLNRDSGAKSNTYVGRTGKELVVRGSDGNVGIGTGAENNYKLKVNGNTKIEGNLSVDKDISTTGELLVTKKSTLTGKVGIGVAPGTEQLKIKGDTAIAGALSITKLLFEEGGQIRSHDDNHRILFRRSEDILELREYGDIVFSSGATAGKETAKMRLNSAGNLTVSARIADKTGSVMPVGAILSYGGATAPKGWLLCDGKSYKRTDYPDLYKIISNNFGSANGTAFNVPDLRGRFLRGVNKGTGRDPDAGSRAASAAGGNNGDRVGSVQEDQFKSHNHSYTKFPNGRGDIASGKYWKAQEAMTEATGGNETRPKNVNVNYIIKS